jgi:hypothetical protein
MADFWANRYWNGSYWAERYWGPSEPGGASFADMAATLSGAATVTATASATQETPQPRPQIPTGSGWTEYYRRQQRRKREIEQARAAVKRVQRDVVAGRDHAARRALESLQRTAERAEAREFDEADAFRRQIAEHWRLLAGYLEAAAETRRRADMAAVLQEIDRLERAAFEEAERARLEFEADEEEALALLLAA